MAIEVLHLLVTSIYSAILFLDFVLFLSGIAISSSAFNFPFSQLVGSSL